MTLLLLLAALTLRVSHATVVTGTFTTLEECESFQKNQNFGAIAVGTKVKGGDERLVATRLPSTTTEYYYCFDWDLQSADQLTVTNYTRTDQIKGKLEETCSAEPVGSFSFPYNKCQPMNLMVSDATFNFWLYILLNPLAYEATGMDAYKNKQNYFVVLQNEDVCTATTTVYESSGCKGKVVKTETLGLSETALYGCMVTGYVGTSVTDKTPMVLYSMAARTTFVYGSYFLSYVTYESFQEYAVNPDPAPCTLHSYPTYYSSPVGLTGDDTCSGKTKVVLSGTGCFYDPTATKSADSSTSAAPEEFFDMNALQTTETSPVSVPTYGFSVIGFGFLLFGAYKHYSGKSEEFTPLEMA